MFEKLLENIAAALAAHQIPYMVIGGQAVLVYGEPRLTRDIDITLGIGIDELPRMLAVADQLQFRPLVQDVEEFVAKTYLLPLKDDKSEIRIDFVFSFSEYEQQAIQRARKVKIGSAEVQFASLEDLIIHKIVAGRPRDLEDARNILIKNPAADFPYIRKWLGEFDRSLGEHFTETFEALLKAAQ